MVFVDGRRKGSAVLVDDRHLLTAEHVVGAAGEVVVRFVAGRAAGLEVTVTRRTDCPVLLDMALLEITERDAELFPRRWSCGRRGSSA